jgi:transposase
LPREGASVIGSTRSLRVFAYAQPADLRKGFDGLYGIVTAELERDPLDGDCFLFVNRARSRAKVLLWDGTGLCIYMKRLEQNRFACLWDEAGTDTPVELTMSELALFLEGSKAVGRISLSPTQIKPAPLAKAHFT